MKKVVLLLLTIVIGLSVAACNRAPEGVDVEAARIKIAEVKAQLTIDADLNNVTEDLTLITSLDGVTITWGTSNAEVISTAGAVTRPLYEDGDEEVTLTATLSLTGAEDTKAFDVTVKRLPITDEQRVRLDAEALTNLYYASDGRLVNLESVIKNVSLQQSGLEGSTITWTVDGDNTISGGYEGTPAEVQGSLLKIYRPDSGTTNGEGATFTLTATISYGTAESETVVFTLTMPEMPSNPDAAVDELWGDLLIDVPIVVYYDDADKPDSGYDLVKGDGIIGHDFSIIIEDEFGYGATYTWVSNNAAIEIDVENEMAWVHRQEENTEVRITVTISLEGAESKTKTFDLIVKAVETDTYDKLQSVKESLSLPSTIDASDNYIEEFLPTGWDGDVDITWEATGANKAYISGDGTVIHPGDADVTVSVTARLTAYVDELYNEKDPLNNYQFVVDEFTGIRVKVEPNASSDWDALIDAAWADANNTSDVETNSLIQVVKNDYDNIIRTYVVFDGVEYDIEVKNTLNSKTGEKDTVYFYKYIETKTFEITVAKIDPTVSFNTFRATGGQVYTLNPHNFEYSSEGGVISSIVGTFYGTFPDPDTAYLLNDFGQKVDADPYAPTYGSQVPGEASANGVYFEGYEWRPVFAANRAGSQDDEGWMPYDVNGDGTRWQITIRDDLYFNSGKHITVDDYIYSYRMLLDSRLSNYRAYTLFDDIKVSGAKAYWISGTSSTNSGFSQNVGISKISDYVIQFDLDQPETVESFMAAMSSVVLSPVNSEYYKISANGTTDYGSTLEKMDGSGAYKLTAWTQGLVRLYALNEDFPLNKQSFIDENPYLGTAWDYMSERVVESNLLALQLFENGYLDMGAASGESAKYYIDNGQENVDYYQSNSTATWKLSVNTNRSILQNENLRKALYYGVDRATMTSADGPAYPHQPTATILTSAFYPEGIFEGTIHGVDADGNVVEGLGVPYTQTPYGKNVATAMKATASDEDNYAFDPITAIESFNIAANQLGQDKITIEILTFDGSDELKQRSEWLEKMYESLFNDHEHATYASSSQTVKDGIYGAGRSTYDVPFSNTELDIVLKFVPSNVAYNTMMAFNYDLAWNAWNGGQFDPWGMLEVFKGESGDGDYEAFRQKLEPFDNAEFNRLIAIVSSSGSGGRKNPQSEEEYLEKLEYLEQLETILLESYEFIPLYTSRSLTLFSDRISLPTEYSVPGLGYGVSYAIVTLSDQELVG